MLSGLPVGPGRMLPWESAAHLLNLSSGLHLRALTCSDLGCTGRQDLLFLWPLLPAPAGKDFLGMVLPLATESQNQPSKTYLLQAGPAARSDHNRLARGPGLPSPALFY